MPDLAEVMRLIDEGYRFDHESYPRLFGVGNETRFAFGLSHSLLHIAKSQGVLAAQLEQVDHGGQFDTNEIKRIALKQVVNTLKLAAHLGLTAEDVSHHVTMQYKK